MHFEPFAPLQPGDTVAIVSPSGDAASYFPWVVDKGIERLERFYGLRAREYPATRQRKPSAKARADDLMAAFSDDTVKAVITTLGGNDQLQVLPELNATVMARHPKPFMGYSDNTNVGLFLWNLGIASYYGGALMTQFAMPGGILAETDSSIRRALFEGGTMQVAPAKTFTDIESDWADKANLDILRTYEGNEGWYWAGEAKASGRLWGGCVDSLIDYIDAGMPVPAADGEPIILFLETSESIPPHEHIERLLHSLERVGILARTSAILVGRPKAWSFDKQRNATQRAAYRAGQRDSVIATARQLGLDIPIVQNLDFGHTDPQIIIPAGRIAHIDCLTRAISFYY